jgi:ribonuclease III
LALGDSVQSAPQVGGGVTPAPGSQEALCARLGHDFVDPARLDEALTHPSRRAESGDGVSYERLEFLGDRVLGLIVAELLFEQYPDEPEGALARRFAALVSGETLAQIAGALELGAYLRLAKSERAAGGLANPANLANLCEALIGALYLDGGLAAAQAFVCREWAARLAAPGEPPRDAKTALQEWSQAGAHGLPAYRTVETSGPAHAPEFDVEVTVEGLGAARGRGPSKRAAEQVAATALLATLEDGNARAGGHG